MLTFQVDNFLSLLDDLFDITPMDACDRILNDRTRSELDKEEDIAFIKNIRENKPAILGSLDLERIKKFDRIALRAEKQRQREKKEEERKKVN